MATVDLEQFMIDARKGTGFTFNTFHTIFRYVNDRYFGNTLYKQIKSGEVSVDEVVRLMKGVM